MTPTLDDIKQAARRFRANGHSVLDLREILQTVTGLSLTVVDDVPPEDREAVIARLEGREAAKAKGAGSSLLTDDGTAVDPVKVFAKWNATGVRRA